MRCLALAQAWQDVGGHAIFAMAESTESVVRRIISEKMEFERVEQAPGSAGDSENIITLARRHAAQWVVVDGYVFRAEYQDRFHESGLKLLVVDDDGRAEHYVAEIVLNSNPRATEALYSHRGRSTKLLLGPEYILMRREFAVWRGCKRKMRAPVKNVLVTMGGSDPDNVTQRVIEALIAAPEFEVQIVAGGSNPHLAKLREATSETSQHLRLVHNAGNMADLMAWADAAISAAGTAAWEMAFMGLPALLVELADNQAAIASALVDAGAALCLGPASSVGREEISNRLRGLGALDEDLQKMSMCGRALVDGRGAERVVTAMLERDRVMRPERSAVPAAVKERT